jgi:DNA-binding NtrC family response regulator
LPELSQHLLEEVRRRYNLPQRRLSPAALQALGRRRWAGNVRELRHVLAGASLAAAGDSIQPDDLPPERSIHEVAPGAEGTISANGSHGVETLGRDGHAIRSGSIASALRATAGHRGRAAKLLGISRSTLYRYLQSPDNGDVDGQEG